MVLKDVVIRLDPTASHPGGASAGAEARTDVGSSEAQAFSQSLRKVGVSKPAEPSSAALSLGKGRQNSSNAPPLRSETDHRLPPRSPVPLTAGSPAGVPEQSGLTPPDDRSETSSDVVMLVEDEDVTIAVAPETIQLTVQIVPASYETSSELSSGELLLPPAALAEVLRNGLGSGFVRANAEANRQDTIGSSQAAVAPPCQSDTQLGPVSEDMPVFVSDSSAFSAVSDLEVLDPLGAESEWTTSEESVLPPSVARLLQSSADNATIRTAAASRAVAGEVPPDKSDTESATVLPDGQSDSSTLGEGSAERDGTFAGQIDPMNVPSPGDPSALTPEDDAPAGLQPVERERPEHVRPAETDAARSVQAISPPDLNQKTPSPVIDDLGRSATVTDSERRMMTDRVGSAEGGTAGTTEVPTPRSRTGDEASPGTNRSSVADSSVLVESTHPEMSVPATKTAAENTARLSDVSSPEEVRVDATRSAEGQAAAARELAPQTGFRPDGVGSSDAASPSDVDTQRLVERVSSAVQRTFHSGGQLRIRLHPPELGAVHIEVTHLHGTITARLEVHSGAAHQALTEQLAQLREAITQSGAPVERIDIHLAENRSYSQDSNPNSHSEQEFAHNQSRDRQDNHSEADEQSSEQGSESSDGFSTIDELDVQI